MGSAVTVTRSTYASSGGSNLNDKLIVKQYEKQLFTHGLAANPFKPFMGTGSDKIFQVKKNLMKSKGDTVDFTLRGILTGNGQSDDGTYEGNEESISLFSMSATIHERGNAVKVNGEMSEQRTIVNLRDESKSALGEWNGRVQALDMICALSGLPTLSLAVGVRSTTLAQDASSHNIETVNPVALTKSATATRYFAGGQTVAGVFERVAKVAAIDSTSGNLFGTLVISKVKRMATEAFDSTGAALCPLRPVMVDGKEYFVMFINPRQAKDLKSETAWITAQKDAGVRGLTNALFTGALGIWDGVVIIETPWILTRTGKGGVTATEYFDSTTDPCANGVTVARALFCGAQAAVIAYGKLPTWHEKLHDYDKKFGVQSDSFYGIKKTLFDSATTGGTGMSEFGCIVVDTAVSPD